MKALKILGLGVVGVLVGVLVLAAFLPSTYQIQRSIQISKSSDEILARISDFNWWKNFSPWAELDPQAKYEIQGVPGLPGHAMIWDGQEVGAGKMTIAEVTPGLALKSKLEFTRPMTSVATDHWKLETTAGGATLVTWSNEGSLGYPMGRIFGYFFLPKQLGADYEKGLAQLKSAIEAGK